MVDTSRIVYYHRQLRRGEPITAADFSTEFGLHEAIEEQETLGWNNYLLGRWSPKWQQVQAQYFASISSQKTSRRWATAILHQFFMNAWDMWQYRNDRLHGPAGPLVLDQHRQLNLRIEEEMIAGCTDMHRPSRYLIRANTLLELKHLDIPAKKLWLRSVHLARKDFAAPAFQSDAYADERSNMLHWLT